ncbi:MAG TPA: hypothetical protein PKB09_02580 [Candidatus Saccharibacteria bacterium]|nr:hypothetical protein [Candidatus Saccharibacteria bacterium]
MGTYWRRQSSDKPLFPELAWDKPENKRLAGKLLIIGGNAHGFSAPGQAYQIAQDNGIGVAKVLLPDALQKSVGKILENGEYAPSTKSGSFGHTALESWTAWANWADGVLIAGDLGRNSETAVVLEKFITVTTKPLFITKDAVDYFRANAKSILVRDNTVLILSLSQLQKFCLEIGWTSAVTFQMTILQLVEFLHRVTLQNKVSIVTSHNGNYFVAYKGMVSTTKNDQTDDIWRVEIASKASVWYIQNPTKPFEALTTAVV